MGNLKTDFRGKHVEQPVLVEHEQWLGSDIGGNIRVMID